MSPEIDWKKVDEYATALGELETARREKRKLFDPKKLVEDSRKIRKVYDDELGWITYKPLTFADLNEIQRAQNNEEKSIIALYKMLQKTYPDLTLDDVRDFGLDGVVRLLKLILGPAGFLQVPKMSLLGSNQAQTPSKLDSSPTSFK